MAVSVGDRRDPLNQALIGLMFLTLALVSLSTPAQAEYRVYRLKITDTQSQASRIVVTTLDNVQYRGYYPIRKSEMVTIDAMWMCWDREGRSYPHPYCPQPPPPSPSSRQPASTGPKS